MVIVSEKEICDASEWRVYEKDITDTDGSHLVRGGYDADRLRRKG